MVLGIFPTFSDDGTFTYLSDRHVQNESIDPPEQTQAARFIALASSRKIQPNPTWNHMAKNAHDICHDIIDIS